ncbi:MAG TPA: hypothetical protein VGX52_15025 [Burkholderiales bacterium]|nr:hypothetical protein [Burkholderiales bacterium]
MGEPIGEEERNELAAYLAGLGLNAGMPVHQALTWKEAGALCRTRSDDWWRAEEDERTRLERSARLDPADPDWLALNEALHGTAAVAAARAGCADAALIRVAAGAASYAAYQARLARAAGAASGHPFLRKYALYCGGRWPLGIYHQSFAIF